MKKLSLIVIILFTVLTLTSCKNINEELKEVAINLKYDDVQSWLIEHDIEVPEDLKSQINVDEFVLEVINKANNGLDISIGISYDKTIKLIKSIQKAAGFTFD